MQLTRTKIGIYQVRCTYYMSSIFHFFLDRQFRGDVVRKKIVNLVEYILDRDLVFLPDYVLMGLPDINLVIVKNIIKIVELNFTMYTAT